jgi:hypothetical protein
MRVCLFIVLNSNILTARVLCTKLIFTNINPTNSSSNSPGIEGGKFGYKTHEDLISEKKSYTERNQANRIPLSGRSYEFFSL